MVAMNWTDRALFDHPITIGGFLAGNDNKLALA